MSKSKKKCELSEKQIEKKVRSSITYWNKSLRGKYPRFLHRMVKWDMKRYHGVPKTVTQKYLNIMYPIRR